MKSKRERNLKQIGDRWYFDFSKDGKRYIRLGGRSKEEAQAAMWKLKAEVKDGPKARAAEVEDPYFDDFAKEYLELYAKRPDGYGEPKKRSWERDQQSIVHLNKAFGRRRLSQISLLLVERYRVGRLAEVSFSTVNRELSCLKGILNKAIDWEKLASFPIRKIEIDVKSEPRRDRVLTPEEEVRLLAEASEHLRPMIVLALETGMRRGEVIKLRAEHVNLAERRITIPRENAKSKKPRGIPLTLAVVDLLKPIVPTSGFVFNKANGVHRRHIGYGFRAACERAKIEDFVFHDLRRTYETRQIEGGANPANVRDTMGHHSITFSLDHYYHPSWESRVRAADQVAESIAKGERIHERMPDGPSPTYSKRDN